MTNSLKIFHFDDCDLVEHFVEDGIYCISELDDSKNRHNALILNILVLLGRLTPNLDGMEENPIREAMSEEIYVEFSEMLTKLHNGVYNSGDILPIAFSEIDLALLFVRSAVCLLGKQKVYNICSDYSINYARFGRKAWETRLRQSTVKPMFYLAKDVAVPKVTATWAV